VVHGQIILAGGVLLLLLVLDLELGHLCLEPLLPPLVEGVLRDELVILDAGVEFEHGGVTVPELEVDLAHLPLEGGLVEAGEVPGDETDELFADVLEFGEVVFAVELEGTVHDPAVVESGYGEGGLAPVLLHGGVRFILDASH